MKVKQLHLQNYGRFEDLTINFAPLNETQKNVTVIVGNNGAGKSQILQALAKGFYLFIEEMNKLWLEESNIEADIDDIDERLITPLEVKNDTQKSQIGINIISEGIESIWNISSQLYSNKRIGKQSYNFGDSDLISEVFNMQFPFNDAQLPMIAFYSIDRANNIETYYHHLDKYKSEPLDGYINAIDSQIDFDGFVRWFRQREDIENADIRKSFDILIQKAKNETISNKDDLFIKEVMALVSKESLSDNNKDKQLWATKQVVTSFLENLTNIWIDRESEPPTMKVQKSKVILNINQLSQGEKSLLALVGDIARRLAILNPSLDNPLEGEGVVMIDEVDLHLHPKWQHDLIDKLVKTFPNVQFILTTHSPHIISDNPDILVYALNDGELTQVPNVYGEDVNTVLTKVFDVDIRDSKVQEPLDDIRRAISHKDFEMAKTKIDEMAKILPTGHMELLKSRLMLAQAQLAEKQEKSL